MTEHRTSNHCDCAARSAAAASRDQPEHFSCEKCQPSRAQRTEKPGSAELERQQNEAMEMGESLARQLMPMFVQIRYRELSPNVIFWATFLAALHGHCAAIVGKEHTEAVFTMVKGMLDTSRLGETEQ